VQAAAMQAAVGLAGSMLVSTQSWPPVQPVGVVEVPSLQVATVLMSVQVDELTTQVPLQVTASQGQTHHATAGARFTLACVAELWNGQRHG